MKKRSKLSFEEYQEIYKKYELNGWGIREIARHLGRSGSTVSRLLRRSYRICRGVWKKMSWYEKAHYAWQASKKRKRRRRLRLKSKRIGKLVTYILFKWHWSPEVISRFLLRHGLTISAKSIYNFIKYERSYLKDYLRQRGKTRRQRVARKRSLFRLGTPEKKNIRLRPEIIEEGHWEIDTVLSKKGVKAGVLTLRERKSKQCFYFLIPNLQAETVIRILLPFFQSLPPQMRKTLTSDNGSEFEQLYKLEKVLEGFGVFYCDPYKAWQRGSVENANAELRWYFPKKTDFSRVTQVELSKAEYKINGKPRETLGDRSSKAVFTQLMKAA